VTIPPTPRAADVDWSRLDGRQRELLKIVGLRLLTANNAAEIADDLNHDRPELQHLDMPEQVTSTWVNKVTYELRLAIVEAAVATMTTISSSWSTAS
jgi:hypothetical protein